MGGDVGGERQCGGGSEGRRWAPGGTAEDDGGAKWGETTTTKEVWGVIAATTKIARGRRLILILSHC